MSGACGGAAYHQYAKMANPRLAGITLAIGATYLWAGWVARGRGACRRVASQRAGCGRVCVGRRKAAAARSHSRSGLPWHRFAPNTRARAHKPGLRSDGSRMLVNGNPRLGYDLGLITSLGVGGWVPAEPG
jgi:hypothetical protein